MDSYYFVTHNLEELIRKHWSDLHAEIDICRGDPTLFNGYPPDNQYTFIYYLYERNTYIYEQVGVSLLITVFFTTMKRPLRQLPEDKLANYINRYVVPQRAKVRKMILRTQKNKAGECKIYVEIRRYRYLSNEGKKYESKPQRLSTDIWVKDTNWSKKKGEVLKSDFGYSEKNRIINQKYSEVLKYISSDDLDYIFALLSKTDLLKIEELFPSKKMLLGRYLTDYLDKYIEFRKGFSARGTWKEFITLKNRILNYELSSGKKLRFNDINNSFSNDFYLWLNKTYSNGTIYKTYELLVTLMYHYWNVRDEQKIEMNDKFAQKGFKKGNKESNEPNPLSEDEYQLLLKKSLLLMV